MTDLHVKHVNVVSTISTSLLQGIQAQNEDSWIQMHSLFGPLVLSWCRRKGLPIEQAQEVTQEVFLAVNKNVATRFAREKPKDTFRGWLWTITRRKIIDWLRKKGNENELEFDPVDPFGEQAEEPEFDQGTKMIVQSIFEFSMKKFKSENWEAFFATEVEGRAVEDVAIELNISRNQIYVARGRIRKRLEQEFGKVVNDLFPVE